MVTYPKTSAEKALILREKFINNTYVSDNGGVASVGAVSADQGQVFADDLVIDYADPNINRVFKTGIWSIRLCTTISNLGTDGGATMGWLFDANNRWYFEFPRSGNPSWRTVAAVNGGGAVSAVGDNLTNGYHEIVITVSGVTWLAYLDGAPTNWSGVGVQDLTGMIGDSEFFIGGTASGTATANGKFYIAEMYDRVLTAEEALDLYEKDTFIETDAGNMDTFLPLKTFFHDGANNVTSNIGKNANAVWGNGAGADEPTIKSPNGATFDGADSLIKLSASDELAVSDRTVGAVIKLDSFGEGGFGNIFGNSKMVLDVWYLTSDAYGTSIVLPSGALTVGEYYSVIATRTSAGIGEIYVNAISKVSGTTGTPEAGGATYLGNNAGKTRTFDGDIHFPFNYEGILTPTQIQWVHDKMFRELNV